MGRYLSRLERLTVCVILARSGHQPPGRLTSVTFGATILIELFDDMATAVTALAMEGLD